jgi:hypothetical protein
MEKSPEERVTPKERQRFHKILDDSIDKMNSPKNANKMHWSTQTIQHLQKLSNIESAELDCAVFMGYFGKDIESENFDLINLNMMMVDNLRGNK